MLIYFKLNNFSIEREYKIAVCVLSLILVMLIPISIIQKPLSLAFAQQEKERPPVPANSNLPPVPTGKWNLQSNGLHGILNITSIDNKGRLDGFMSLYPFNT